MSPRVFSSLVAALIRIGLLLALVIMLMAENAQAQPVVVQPVCSPAGVPLELSRNWTGRPDLLLPAAPEESTASNPL